MANLGGGFDAQPAVPAERHPADPYSACLSDGGYGSVLQPQARLEGVTSPGVSGGADLARRPEGRSHTSAAPHVPPLHRGHGASHRRPQGGAGHGQTQGQGGGTACGEDEESEYDEEGESDCGCDDCGSESERQHFAEVCYSLVAYAEDAEGEIQFMEDTLAGVTCPYDRALLGPQYEKMLADARKCVKVNAKFLAMLVRTDAEAQEFAQIPDGHKVDERNAMKARTVLRQLVRDWAEEGRDERESQYGDLLRALQKYKPWDGKSKRPRVLCPGSGLSRLPFEATLRGYSAQGNEFSYHMLQACKWVLNETISTKTHKIYPFLLTLDHRKGARDHLRSVKIPDVCPSEALCPGGRMIPGLEFSMNAGEFVQIYSEPQQHGAWDAVLTCFFIDTAKNIFLYIRTIAEILPAGGLWANLGPLLFHYAEQPDAISIELSWEEIKPEICKYFDFQEEDMRKALYTSDQRGLYQTVYNCVFFAAIRNRAPVHGLSNPVF